MSNRILLDNAKKLGVQVIAIRKAEEFLRTLENNCYVKTINDVTKGILCLDLATRILGLGFDKETALKLCSLRKTQYQQKFNILEKILNLDKTITISELCVQLQCTIVKNTAEKLLKDYKSTNKVLNEIDHPQYTAVAVFVACKIHNIKVDKRILLETSRLKLPQWKELIAQFELFSQKMQMNFTQTKQTENNVNKDNKTEMENRNIDHVQIKDDDDNQIEEYEIWKARILKEARALLKK